MYVYFYFFAFHVVHGFLNSVCFVWNKNTKRKSSNNTPKRKPKHNKGGEGVVVVTCFCLVVEREKGKKDEDPLT